jgi:ubiquinone/menaquinone biosynthesis C-methylase UbiE
METKAHWEKIYQTKQPSEVSWTQNVPESSLRLLHSFKLPQTAAVIDIGGGDSRLVDHLLNEDFQDISVLDISENALARAKKRLEEKAKLVKWIVSDITEFVPERKYDLWHDRATFHFLTTEEQIEQYISTAMRAIADGGYAIISTFSKIGPDKCSGLEIRKYSEELLQAQLTRGFKKLECFTEDHLTPFGTVQNFLFCGFQKGR